MRFLAVLLVFGLHGCATQDARTEPPRPTLVRPAKEIPLSQIQQMFSQMRANTRWNVDGPLLWSYFFYDADDDKLKQVAPRLQAMGYKVVCVDGYRGRSFIHIERVETHTPESLHARNEAFYAFAKEHDITSYDGMDVGPVSGPRLCGRVPRR